MELLPLASFEVEKKKKLQEGELNWLLAAW